MRPDELKGLLKELVQSADGLAAAIVGSDGIAVASHSSEGSTCDVDTLCAEWTRTFKEIVRLVERLNLGGTEELYIGASTGRLIVRAVGRDHLLLLLMGKEGISGRARYLLKRLASMVEEELC